MSSHKEEQQVAKVEKSWRSTSFAGPRDYRHCCRSVDSETWSSALQTRLNPISEHLYLTFDPSSLIDNFPIHQGILMTKAHPAVLSTIIVSLPVAQ